MESFTELSQDFENTDIDFCHLYFQAIKQLLNMDDPKNTNYFRRYLELLRTQANANCEFYENPDDQDNTLTTLFMENLFYRIAYVYRNSTLYSSAVAFHFQNILESNLSVMENLMQKRKIRICSLGCGPASDVVAVVKILESAAKKRSVSLDIRVTVVDADLSWKNTCLSILRCIPMFARATWKIKFIQADLSQFFSLDTVDAIQNADVVTLVKFSSEYVGSYLSCSDTIKEISETMNPGSLLFFLDRPNINVMGSCGGIKGDIQNFCLIYEEIYDFLNLHLAAIERNYHLYEKHLGRNVCNTCFKVFCRAWIKSRFGGSSKSPFSATECGNSTGSPSIRLRSESHRKISETGSYFDDNLLPSWRRTERENHSEHSIVTLHCSDCLAPHSLQGVTSLNSDVENLLTSSKLTDECDGSLAASSIWTGYGNCLTSSLLRVEEGGCLSNSSIKTKVGNHLETESVSLGSQSEMYLMNSPIIRFGEKREKFNLLEFFRLRPYRTWHHYFCLQREEEGWNFGRIQIYDQDNQEMWDYLHFDLKEKIKMVEDIREELIINAQRQSGVICKSIWKKFMISKRELAFVKRTIFCEIVILLRGYLKSKFPITKN